MRTKKWFLLASSLTILNLLLASCTPAAAPTGTSQALAPTAVTAPKGQSSPVPTLTPKAATEQPKYGGSLALPSPSDPPNLDIHKNSTVYLFSPAANIYNGLVQYDASDKVVADLAERWEISPDGKTYTFALRNGVKWHDGQPFTSADAKLSLERIMPYDGLNWATEAIDKVEALDENTLKVTLKRRQSAFLPLIGSGRALIGPKHVVEAKGDLKRDMMGTGPFRLKEYMSGVSFILEKNKEYYAKGRPYLDGIVFYIIRDTATRLAGFRTGRLQIYGHPPAQTELGRMHADLIRREMPQVVVRPYETRTPFALVPNCNRTPWNDIRVRRAAFLAVDREKGLEVVSEGVGALGVSVYYGEWSLPKEELMKMPGFRKPKDEDIAEAKRLLSEAGYPRGFKSSVVARANDSLSEKAATFASDQLSKIGIELRIEIVEYAVHTEVKTKLNYDTMLLLSGLPLVDPDGAARSIAKKLGGQLATIDDDKILELHAKQSQAATLEERRQLVFELQRRIAEVIPHIMIAWQNQFIAFWPQVKNYNVQGGIYSHNNLEEIWLATQ